MTNNDWNWLHLRNSIAVLRGQAAINGSDHPATARLRALADELERELGTRPAIIDKIEDPSFYGAEY